MHQIALWIERVARQLGGPGLFAVSLLDSSILPLPELNDLLIVFMVASHEERMIYYAAMATLGSIAGCFVIYFIGAKGGDKLKRRFQGKYSQRAEALFQKYGMIALIVPAILPPPAPFKVFVLMAGSARMAKSKFALALALGRGFRFFGIGLLAALYGDAAIEFVRVHGRSISLVVGGAVLVGGLAFVLYKRRSGRAPAPAGQE